MKSSKYYLILLNLILVSQAFGQSIKGTVVNKATNESLIGVNIFSKTLNIGTITDEHGEFTLQFPKNYNETSAEFDVSYVGFITQSITLKEGSNQKVFLEEDILLEEVTVQASIVGSKPLEQLATSYNKIDTEELTEDQSFTSMSDLLNGRSGSMQVFNANGKVGTSPRFNIRSNATFSLQRDPLVFVDGVRMNTSNISDVSSAQESLGGLNDLNPNDIESIEILKGPAASASYGAEAANGVIIIRTKRGTSDNLKVDLKYSQGVNTLANKYNQYVNNDPINNFYQKGKVQNYYASVSGKSGDYGKFHMGFDQRNNESHVPGNKELRSTFNGTYDYAKDKFNFGFSGQYSIGEVVMPPTGSGKYDATWNLVKDQEPWPYLTEEAWSAQHVQYNNNRFMGSAYLGFNPIENLSIKSLVGLDQNDIEGVNYKPYGHTYGNIKEGQKTLSNRRNTNLNWENSIRYNWEINSKHTLSFAGITQLNQELSTSNAVTGQNFPSAEIDNIGAAGLIKRAGENQFEKRSFGIYGEATYAYDNKLFVSAGLRRDMSNLMGSNVSSIVYPQVNVAYNLDKEAWAENIFDSWKVRAAYGESGRLPHPLDAKTSYKAVQTATGSGYEAYVLGNPDIKPERSKEIELGTDITYKRLDLSFTYYQQHTVDAIIYTDLPPSEGWVTSSAKYAQNVGEIKGSGVELNFNYRLWNTNDNRFSVDLFGNVNWQQNEVIDTGGEEFIYFASTIQEGMPAYAFYNPKSEGAKFDEKGEYNGEIVSDYQYLGKPFPDYQGSFGVNVTLFKNLSASALFTYATGFQVYNISSRNVARLGDNLYAKENAYENMNNYTIGSPEYIKWANELSTYESSRGNFIEDGDFLRLSNVTLSYDLTDLTKSLISQNGINSLRVSFSGSNLWMITKYSGPDPLVAGEGGSKVRRGMSHIGSDWTSVPPPKTYMFTVHLGI